MINTPISGYFFHMEACYQDANQEMDDIFEITTSDGLEENETLNSMTIIAIW